jgi:hypothetical protein
MSGQFEPLQEFAYNIHFSYIQEIFDFADIFASHENKSTSSFESLRYEKIRGQIAEKSSLLRCQMLKIAYSLSPRGTASAFCFFLSLANGTKY